MTTETTLTTSERHLARRALGLGFGRSRRAHRNHYLCPTHQDWEHMVARGLATVRRSAEPNDGAHTYRLTRAGAEAALEPGETVPEDLIPEAMPA